MLSGACDPVFHPGEYREGHAAAGASAHGGRGQQDAGPTRCAARVRTTHGSCGWDEKGDKKPGKMENPWENDGNWWNMGET